MLSLRRLLITVFVVGSLAADTNAQSTASIQGRVTERHSGLPIAGATIQIVGTSTGTATDIQGRYRITGLPTGTLLLRIRSVGYHAQTREVELVEGDDLIVDVELTEQTVGLGGVEITALRPSLEPQDDLSARRVRETHAPEAGALMRALPGLNAARRGAIGLDPNIRGLTETEVGAYIDGVRFFPAGPLRMDSQISHFDPTSIRRIEVVKGPYALIWGAGNMSTIRVERLDADHYGRGLGGFFHTGYNSNIDEIETAGSISGHASDVSFWIHGAYRDGNAYKAGNGASIPGNFSSGEIRGRFGYHFGPNSSLSIAGGYNRQDDIDYPGRLLNADFFDAIDVSAHFQQQDFEGMVRKIDAMLYWNGVSHGMTNDGKPTAVAGLFPNGNPRPPLVIRVDAETKNVGGRLALDLAPEPALSMTVGGDFYSANRDATRPFFAVMPNGNLVVPSFYSSDEVWPDVTITDVGVFANAALTRGGITATATGRVDLVSAGADRASEAYLMSTGASTLSDLDANETNLSGAVTVSRKLGDAWSASAGLGSVVRTADALERYSDRIPASKAQTSAEFMGNPNLKPERATQVDLWLDGSVRGVHLGFSAFARQMVDFITLEATNIPKLLPLSPDVVFRYVNGRARFYGGEFSLSAPLTYDFTFSSGFGYLWGKDEMLDEPALGVSPWRADFGLRFEPVGRRLFVEATGHVTGDQNRAATTRGEVKTTGYASLDLRAGITIVGNASILVGVNNVFDEYIVNHLNASNPFNGSRIPEPGRVFFSSVRVSL